MNKIIKVSGLADGFLEVNLQDGRCGVFDVKPFIQSVFFGALRSENYFKQVGLFFEGDGWPDGQDLGPDTIAAQLRTMVSHAG